MTAKGLVITWGVIGKIVGAMSAAAVVIFYIGSAGVWALEHHFDDRYLLVASTYEGELRKLSKEIYLLEKSGDDPDYLEFLEEQRDEIQDQIDKAAG